MRKVAGLPILRWMTVEAARVGIRWDPHWRQVYERIHQRGDDSVAVITVAHKLLVVVWHWLARRQPYYHLQSQTSTTKLQTWACTIGRHHLRAALPSISSGSIRSLSGYSRLLRNSSQIAKGGHPFRRRNFP